MSEALPARLGRLPVLSWTKDAPIEIGTESPTSGDASRPSSGLEAVGKLPCGVPNSSRAPME